MSDLILCPDCGGAGWFMEGQEDDPRESPCRLCDGQRYCSPTAIAFAAMGWGRLCPTHRQCVAALRIAECAIDGGGKGTQRRKRAQNGLG